MFDTATKNLFVGSISPNATLSHPDEDAILSVVQVMPSNVVAAFTLPLATAKKFVPSNATLFQLADVPIVADAQFIPSVE